MNFKRMTIAALSVMLTFAVFSVSYGAPLDAIYPKNGASDVTPGDITLVWENTEGYSYEVWGGKNAASMDKLIENTMMPIADMKGLSSETTYYWRVIASSAVSSDIISQVWTFTTSDRPTYEITVKYPTDNGKDVPFGQVTLQWHCDEPGMRFDVYFGSNATSLERVATNTSKMIWDVTAPQGGKYFWQLVLRDSEGNEGRSQIWSFTTKGDDSIGGGCTISSSPFSLLLGIPLIMINKISR